MFGVSDKREDTFAAGLSMGGYGALKLALRNPERFGGAAGLSATADPLDFALNMGGPLTVKEAPAIWGPDLKLKDEDNLFELAKQAAALPEHQRPRIYSCCGMQDGLFDQNLKFRDAMEKLPIEYKFEAWEGVHNWKFWEVAVVKGLDFLLKK